MLVALPNPGIIAGPRLIGPVSAAATRDWCIRTLCALAASPNATIGDIKMALTGGGANVATGGTGRVRQSTHNATDTFASDSQLFDGAASTQRSATSDDLMQAAYELPTAQVLRQVSIIAHDAALASRAPLGFAVMLSEDGRATWKPVAMFTTPATWVGSEQRDFVFDPLVWNSGLGRSAARAWRAVINSWPSGNNPRIGDMAFAASPGGATLCTGGSAICNVSTFSQNPNLAFDGSVATYWNGSGVGVLGQRLGYAFSAPVNAVELRMTAPSVNFASMPTDFDVQWSLDFQTWTTALTVSTSSWSASEARSWVIP